MKILRSLPALLFFTLAASTAAPAQVKIGAFGDLNRSSLSGDAPEDFSYSGRTAVGFGLIGEFHLADDVWLSVQPMILPRGTGVELEIEDQEDPIEYGTLELSYVAVPVLAKFVTAGGKVYVTTGVDISFLTGADLVLEGAQDEPTDVKSAFNDVDFAVEFGVGGQLPLGPVEIMLEARYEQGILNALGDGVAEESINARLRSSGLQLLAGVLLTVGGDR